MLDSLAVSDSVDHVTFFERLTILYSVDGNVVKWFTSYFCDRIQCAVVVENPLIHVNECADLSSIEYRVSSLKTRISS